MKVFPAAYGWWRLICRSAEAVLLLSERGFSVESAPVLRNVLNRRLLDERKSSTDLPARAATDVELVRKLKHEIGNVYDMLDRYGSADVYLVYSHLSGLSHTSVETSSAYLEWTGGATPQIRRDAAGLGPAAVIQLAIALLQAAHVMSPLLADDPLRPNIDQALTDLGLQGTQLFRDRVR